MNELSEANQKSEKSTKEEAKNVDPLIIMNNFKIEKNFRKETNS